MSGISFMGIGSGLPVSEIIDVMLKAEGAPLKRLEHDKEYYKSQISGLGQLKSRLSGLQEAMKKLQGLDKFQMLAANTGNEKLFTAKADHAIGAQAGNYNIEVLAEARNYRYVSESNDDLKKTFEPNETLVFSDLKNEKGEDIPDVEIKIGGLTLDQVRQEINDHKDLKGKVSATLVNEGPNQGRLIMNSGTSGEEGRFTAEFSNDVIKKDSGLSSKDPKPDDDSTSLDARIKIDGIEATSSTNEFTNVISGVTINVTAGAMNESNKAANLGVKRDDAAIKDNIDAFVKAYNDVIIHLNEAKKGSLYGDNTIRSIETELRNVLYAPTEGDDDKDTQKNFLALIGIEVFVEKSFDPDNPSSRNGTLEINSAKLTEALDKNFDKVAHILGSSDRLDSSQPKGYAQRLDELAKDLISGGVRDGKIYKGLLEVRTEGLNKQIKRIDERVESTNMRLELLEQRLIKQFSSIDGIVANLNSMGSFISQQIGSLPGYSRSK